MACKTEQLSTIIQFSFEKTNVQEMFGPLIGLTELNEADVFMIMKAKAPTVHKKSYSFIFCDVGKLLVSSFKLRF